MRLPYLQVTQETWAKARMLSGLLGIGRHEAMGLVVDLWAWAVDLGPSDQPPTGECDGPLARTLLASAVEWRGDVAKLVDALAAPAVELLEVTDRGVRVRGLDRYAKAWERNRKRRGQPITVQSPSNHQPVTAESAPKTQTQTQTQTQTHREATTPPAPVGPVGGLRDGIDAAFKAKRGAAYAWTFADERAIGSLLGKPDATEAEILRRWGVGLEMTRYPTVNCVADLARHWNACAAPQAAGPPKGRDPKRDPIRAEDVDWSAEKAGETQL